MNTSWSRAAISRRAASLHQIAQPHLEPKHPRFLSTRIDASIPKCSSKCDTNRFAARRSLLDAFGTAARPASIVTRRTASATSAAVIDDSCRAGFPIRASRFAGLLTPS